jgi:hypothetical protein
MAHPVWPSGSVYQGVAAAVSWWIAVHLLLIGLYALVAIHLAVVLSGTNNLVAVAARVLLVAVVVCAAAYLTLDGVVVGLLVWSGQERDAAARASIELSVDALWESSLSAALANLAGASWACALLCTAVALFPQGRSRVALLGLGLTATALLMAVFPLPPALAWLGSLSRVTAIATGAYVVYSAGASHLPFALLVVGATLPQHVGPPAVLGMVCVFLATASHARAWGPAVASG